MRTNLRSLMIVVGMATAACGSTTQTTSAATGGTTMGPGTGTTLGIDVGLPGSTGDVPRGCEPDDPAPGPEWPGCVDGPAVPESDFADQAAQALCALYFDCECNDVFGTFGSLQTCVSTMTNDLAALQAEASAAGLTYVPERAGAAIDGWTDRGCKQTSVHGEWSCLCRFYEGYQSAGATGCSQVTFGSTCMGAVACRGPVEGQEESECSGGCNQPSVGLGHSCSQARCYDPDQDLYCAENELCAPVPTVGENCTHDGQCTADAFCPGGDGCEKQQTCTDLPSVGEPCGDRWPGGGVIDIYGACEPGSRCEYVNDVPTCVADPDPPQADGATCTEHHECLGACINNVCATPAKVCQLSLFP